MEEHCIDDFLRVRDDWLTRLKILRAGHGSSLFPSETQVISFTEYLVSGQRNDTDPKMKNGSWAIPLDLHMPSDARVDFAYFPTHIAVAWLVLAAEMFPLLARRIKGFDSALRAGLRFSSLKNFQGHGYDSNRESLVAVNLLALGKVFSYVRKRRDSFMRFWEAMNRLEFDIVHRYPHDDGWTSTDALERQRALALLRGGDALDSRIVPDIHREWRDCQFRAYSNHIITILAKRYAETAVKPLADACLASLDTARSAFDSIEKPSVFLSKYWRIVESEDLFCVKLPSLRGFIAEVIDQASYLEWLPSYSEYQFLHSSRNEIEHSTYEALQTALCDSGVMCNEEYNPIISSLAVGETGEVSITIKVKG
ncbi:hypothetical protein [Nitrococcus mobilis]|uniref:hypothetical protein n=1 Tax=Nitrococcus mobilis TaxID=35797 RepID=UPI001E50F153|nr:hypothetical protein [Nitrococcus mobilis]